MSYKKIFYLATGAGLVLAVWYFNYFTSQQPAIKAAASSVSSVPGSTASLVPEEVASSRGPASEAKVRQRLPTTSFVEFKDKAAAMGLEVNIEQNLDGSVAVGVRPVDVNANPAEQSIFNETEWATYETALFKNLNGDQEVVLTEQEEQLVESWRKQ